NLNVLINSADQVEPVLCHDISAARGMLRYETRPHALLSSWHDGQSGYYSIACPVLYGGRVQKDRCPAMISGQDTDCSIARQQGSLFDTIWKC
ncbi:hypothetical protein, partial [Komagataeibacter saccharivorans]|uniref:hypothetical protein n=1 Tax=Komagataeibacter saccharivorans TaxID=265959 RepID=UPI0039EB6FDF